MKESHWNVWLRDNVPEAFMRVFSDVFMKDPNQKLQYHWVRYLPVEKEVGIPKLLLPLPLSPMHPPRVA